MPSRDRDPNEELLEGLKGQFESDFEEVFAEQTEFACTKTFEVMENHGPVRFTTNCVWDTETLKERPVVQQQGVFLGDILWFIGTKWFASEPQPEDIIYNITKRNAIDVRIGYRILDVVDAEYVYQISLVRLGSIA